MSNKKGFTIVELAVVMVVIGIILGMATKGRDLVRMARVKGETVKLVHLQTAINAYLANHDKLPVVSESAALFVYDTDALIEQGYVNPKDLDNLLDTSSPWILKDCAIDGGYFNWSFGRRGVCFTSETPDMMGELVCNLEISYDDDNLSSGKGRTIAGLASPNFTLAQYDRCATITSRNSYAFRFLQLR